MKTFDAKTAGWYLRTGKRIRGRNWPRTSYLVREGDRVLHVSPAGTHIILPIELVLFISCVDHWVEYKEPVPEEVRKDRERIKERLAWRDITESIRDHILQVINDE